MPRNAVLKVLLVATVPITALAYVAAQQSPVDEAQRVEVFQAPAPLGPAEPIDLRSIDEHFSG